MHIMLIDVMNLCSYTNFTTLFLLLISTLQIFSLFIVALLIFLTIFLTLSYLFSLIPSIFKFSCLSSPLKNFTPKTISLEYSINPPFQAIFSGKSLPFYILIIKYIQLVRDLWQKNFASKWAVHNGRILMYKCIFYLYC